MGPDLGIMDVSLGALSPKEVLSWALSRYEHIGIAFSGAEDVVLIDMAVAIRPDVSVFCLDTGRLHPETYGYLEKVRRHYQIELELLVPDAASVQALVRQKGLFSFYRDGHAECCSVRKVRPLKRKLSGLDAWVTGQRRDQNTGTRSELAVIQIDPVFSGRTGELTKINPLADWSSERVWAYIQERDIPYNPLHERGFVSIGCEPCTRPVLPNQHEREGRWWWESGHHKECGLHVIQIHPQPA